MERAAGTKQRIIERYKYIPRPEADRASRTLGEGNYLRTQTFKKPGDFVLDAALNKKVEVKEPGWH